RHDLKAHVLECPDEIRLRIADCRLRICSVPVCQIPEPAEWGGHNICQRLTKSRVRSLPRADAILLAQTFNFDDWGHGGCEVLGYGCQRSNLFTQYLQMFFPCGGMCMPSKLVTPG